MSPIKVTVPGRTPMERLANLTKRIIAVPKDEIAKAEREWQRSHGKKRRAEK